MTAEVTWRELIEGVKHIERTSVDTQPAPTHCDDEGSTVTRAEREAT